MTVAHPHSIRDLIMESGLIAGLYSLILVAAFLARGGLFH